MKKIALFVFGALALAACNNSYTINGITKNDINGRNVHLINANTNDTLGSCVIKDNSFSFNGNITEPEILKIQIQFYSQDFIAEPGSDITIDLTKGASLFGRTVVEITDNGGYNDKAIQAERAVEKKTLELQEEYNKLVQKVKTEEINEDSLYHFGKYILAELNNMYKENITNNKDNILGAYMLEKYSYRKKLFNNATSLDSVMKTVKYSSKIKALNNLLEEYKSIENK